MENHPQQKDRVREQFTRTAAVFGDYAVASRVGEAEHLARLVRAGARDRAVDLACGPGTLALRFARHVRWVCAFDLTPAILERARRSAATEDLRNIDFALGDAQSLPFPDASLDLAVTSYSLHHIPDPARVIGEMARVVKPGGRVGVLDIIVPEDPQAAALNNHIERLRDASHTRTLPQSELASLFQAHGLRILAAETEDHAHTFDHWMMVAGWKPGDAPYTEARRVLEQTIPDDAAGFHPRFGPAKPAKKDASATATMPELHIDNTVLFLAGEKA
jgi:ubiquinone/menaquinone biosynthesis C-methylase UbiE